MRSTEQNSLLSPHLRAGLLILIALQLLMLAALYSGTPPHPPIRIPLFALGPFISASIALAITAYTMEAGKLAKWIAFASGISAGISYGPHKWVDAAIADIWPAVLLAQIAIVTVLWQLYKSASASKTSVGVSS